MGFFAPEDPRDPPARLHLDLNDWRAVAGRVSATFSTPLPAVLSMAWTDAVLWWLEARSIDAETWGFLRHLRGH